MNASTIRYCRGCSTRLARDNQSSQCAACSAKTRDLLASPPALPPEFWENPRLRDALGSWHMGAVISAYRNHPFHGCVLRQEIVAGWMGITQAQLSRIENGLAITDLGKLIHWATTLSIPAHLLWFQLPTQRHIQPAAGHSPRVAAFSPPAVVRFKLVQVSGDAGQAGSSDMAAMHTFRSADRQVGGGHLYATVVDYLHSDVAPRLFGGNHGGESKAVFTAAAALTEMAGWMAHDAGRDDQARRHFGRALDMSEIGRDRQLTAHVLASMSHLAHHTSQHMRPSGSLALEKTLYQTAPVTPTLKRVFSPCRHEDSQPCKNSLKRRRCWDAQRKPWNTATTKSHRHGSAISMRAHLPAKPRGACANSANSHKRNATPNVLLSFGQLIAPVAAHWGNLFSSRYLLS